MANKSLFQSLRGVLLGKTDAVNEAGGIAFRRSSREELAQYAATGCLNGTYYTSAATQLQAVLGLLERVEPEFIARTALYARQRGFMKDMPALLCASLSVTSPGLMAEIFDRVIDSPKMLRNFVQIMRSGVIGRKSLGSLPKRLVVQWLERCSDEQIFRGSVGNDPSLADVIKMVHPRPRTESREALLGYLLGRAHDAAKLPRIVQEYEAYRHATDRLELETPDVPFLMLTSLDLSDREWTAIARTASWQMTRMNLNAFARHGVFADREVTELVAERLRDPELIAKARVFPYQLLIAYTSAGDLPQVVREALQEAMELAISNVPKIDGQLYVFPDVSGSMHSPITGEREGASSAVRCIDVAALIAAAVLRVNPSAVVVPFESTALTGVRLNPRDTVLTNAQLLASLPRGGTNCSAPLAHLNKVRANGDLVVYVSDNESWVDSDTGGSATATMKQWAAFKARNPAARMICIDLQPHGTTQAKEREDIINVGGFSDQVFDLIAAMAAGRASAGFWVRQIEETQL